MNFELTEEQELIQKTARDFAKNELEPKAEERDRSDAFPSAELRALAELGLMGVNVPEAYGGTEAGVVAYSLAITELARGCAATTVAVAVTNMVAEVICKFGTEAQKDKYVNAITAGEYEAASFALSEPQAGTDAAALRTKAVKDGAHWILNGTKQWITSADHAGVSVVWAKTDPEARGARGITAFLVPADTPGLTIGRHEDKMGLRGSSTVSLNLEDCRVPADAVLGELGQGFKIAMVALDGGRIGVASQALGIGSAALEQGSRYALEREAFGQKLAQMQAIQWMLADSATELEAARLLVLQAAYRKENDLPFTPQASMAKLFASEAAWRVCDRMLQVHGGYGYVKEYPIERFLRDVRVTRIYEGTSEVQRLVIARDVLKKAERFL
jgi:alkylation response protein AidB-like acyl-CoA dehydrogenase